MMFLMKPNVKNGSNYEMRIETGVFNLGVFRRLQERSLVSADLTLDTSEPGCEQGDWELISSKIKD